MTQKTLAYFTGLHRNAIAHVEAGTSDLRLSTLLRIAELLRLQITIEGDAEMNAPLFVFSGEKLVGKLEADATQRLWFTYDPSWLLQPDAIALSLTMPLRAEPYDYPVPQNFFENLLPEAEVRASL